MRSDEIRAMHRYAKFRVALKANLCSQQTSLRLDSFESHCGKGCTRDRNMRCCPHAESIFSHGLLRIFSTKIAGFAYEQESAHSYSFPLSQAKVCLLKARLAGSINTARSHALHGAQAQQPHGITDNEPRGIV